MQKEELILQWKKIRFDYFNTLKEDKTKHKEVYGQHKLYESVVKHLDKSFRDVNQIAQIEIELYIQNNKSN